MLLQCVDGAKWGNNGMRSIINTIIYVGNAVCLIGSGMFIVDIVQIPCLGYVDIILKMYLDLSAI